MTQQAKHADHFKHAGIHLEDGSGDLEHPSSSLNESSLCDIFAGYASSSGITLEEQHQKKKKSPPQKKHHQGGLITEHTDAGDTTPPQKN